MNLGDETHKPKNLDLLNPNLSAQTELRQRIYAEVFFFLRQRFRFPLFFIFIFFNLCKVGTRVSNTQGSHHLMEIELSRLELL